MTFKQQLIACALFLFATFAVAAPPDKGAVKEGELPVAGQAKAKACVWTCRMEKGIEVCRGNGPQCNDNPPASSAAAMKMKMKACVFKCTIENGKEVCRGNGPQCDGVDPNGGKNSANSMK